MKWLLRKFRYVKNIEAENDALRSALLERRNVASKRANN